MATPLLAGTVHKIAAKCSHQLSHRQNHCYQEVPTHQARLFLNHLILVRYVLVGLIIANRCCVRFGKDKVAGIPVLIHQKATHKVRQFQLG